MNKGRWLVLAALLAASPAASLSQALPGGTFTVINNSPRKLSCTYRQPGKPWQPWFRIKPGRNFTRALPDSSLSFFCTPPVRQLSYVIRPGLRYSLLPLRSGEVELSEITAR